MGIHHLSILFVSKCLDLIVQRLEWLVDFLDVSFAFFLVDEILSSFWPLGVEFWNCRENVRTQNRFLFTKECFYWRSFLYIVSHSITHEWTSWLGQRKLGVLKLHQQIQQLWKVSICFFHPHPGFLDLIPVLNTKLLLVARSMGPRCCRWICSFIFKRHWHKRRLLT